ncbi:MAG: hypothetical protein Q7U87_04030 [bacterium]|nr:hypothetical protein [bacterium]
MKKALLAALFVMVISSWCLAQTDSLPAPTAEPCQSAPCAEPCQPGACAMPCQPAPCAEPFVPKWAVGLRASSLTNLPGTLVLQRMLSKRIYLGMGFSYNTDYSEQQNFVEDSTGRVDTLSYDGNSWAISLSPEIVYVFKNTSRWSYAASLGARYGYSKSKSDYYYDSYYSPYGDYSHETSSSKTTSYNIFVGLLMERKVKIKNKEFSVGLATSFISARNSSRTQVGTCYDDNNVFVYKRTYEDKYPWTVNITNPLNTGASISIKYWF